MDLQHLIVKVPIDGDLTVEPAVFIDVFHRWVAEQTLPELLIDVADLRHVPSGPGVILVGLEADYAVDHGDGAWGLLARRKDVVAGTNDDRIRQAIASAAAVCVRLEHALDGKVRFSRTRFDLIVNDRLLAPNTAETASAVAPEVQRVVRALSGQEAVTVTPHAGDPRRRFGVAVETGAALDFDRLATRQL